MPSSPSVLPLLATIARQDASFDCGWGVKRTFEADPAAEGPDRDRGPDRGAAHLEGSAGIAVAEPDPALDVRVLDAGRVERVDRRGEGLVGRQLDAYPLEQAARLLEDEAAVARTVDRRGEHGHFEGVGAVAQADPVVGVGAGHTQLRRLIEACVDAPMKAASPRPAVVDDRRAHARADYGGGVSQGERRSRGVRAGPDPDDVVVGARVCLGLDVVERDRLDAAHRTGGIGEANGVVGLGDGRNREAGGGHHEPHTK